MAVVTIVLPVSRTDHIRRIFAQLDMMPCNREQVHILTVIDGPQELIDLAVTLTEGSKFNQKIHFARRKGIPNVGSVKGRRFRIADIHNEARAIVKNIPCDFIFSLEDDTLIPLNTLEKLLTDYQQHPYAGFISGLELGRWGWESVGAYTANDVYDTYALTSLDPKIIKPQTPGMEQELIKVDAAGLYGCLIKKDNYINHEFKTFENGALGPDIDLGLSLRREGLLNYVDPNLRFDHLTKTEAISFKTANVVHVKISKTEDGKWMQELI